MLKNAKAFSGFSVDNLDAAHDFYAKTLGLEVTKEDMGILGIHIAGNNTIIVYPKDDHEAATYTILNFPVADIHKTIAELNTKGVTFEQYDNEYFRTDKDGVSFNGETNMAWFKDPAGNVLSLIEEQ